MKSIFSLELFLKSSISFNYHCRAVALSINWILWSRNSLWKGTNFNCPLKAFKIFWWCWPFFSIWQVSSLFNLQHVHRKQRQTLGACGQQKVVLCIKYPTNWKLVRYFWLHFASKNTIFGFCSRSQLLHLKFCNNNFFF